MPAPFMRPLIELIEAYRQAKTEAEQVQCCEEIALRVGPDLDLFVRTRCELGAIEDIVQDILTAVVLGLPKFRSRLESQAWSWLHTIARRKIADHFRRENKNHAEPLDREDVRREVEAISQQTSQESAKARERHIDLPKLLDRLLKVKLPCFNYLRDRFMLKLKFKAIGQMYGLTADAARMQVNRCLQLLKGWAEE